MKKLSLILTILIPVLLFSQSCLPDGIEFTTQSQIDSFQIIYPNCTEIEGDVYIHGSITNFNGLNVLNSFGENLTIIGGFDNLIGLEGVTSIGGDLYLGGNMNITDFSGLDNLESIGGSFSISNTEISSFFGLDNLQSIGGSLKIGTQENGCGNNSLLTLDGLEGLVSIGGDLVIFHNEALLSIEAIHNINSASIDNLTISGNLSLALCEVENICHYLTEPNGVVNIGFNGSGCDNVVEIASSCGFNMQCLPYGNYSFRTQSSIDNFISDYSGCTELSGLVYIEGDDINNLEGLSNVTSIDNLRLWGNPMLPELTDLEELVSIESLDIGCYLLTDLSGLEGITSISGTLNVSGNYNLISLEGLNNLTDIGGDLILGYQYWGYHINRKLTNLESLSNLTSIGGNLQIYHNNSLESLLGLDNINAESIENLNISENDSLMNCEVKSICDYLASPNGTIEIHDNASGCNSQIEVEEACETVSVDEVDILNELSIHPNPFSTSTTIEYDLTKPRNVQITVFNYFGQQIEIINHRHYQSGRNQYILDASGFTNGIYFVQVRAGQKVATSKIVKMR